MRVSSLGITLLACACMMVANALAQPVVQLPTFTFAGVGTTVMVPDRGATFLGGIDRAADGRSEAGIPGIAIPGFQNRGIGLDRSASSFWATVTIHDFDAMDQALLSTPSPDGIARTNPNMSRGLSEMPISVVSQPWQRNAVNLAGNWRVEPDPPAHDFAVEHADRMARRATRAAEAEDFFERGRQAEADGKPSVAKIYYQMAARRAAGELKEQVLARLEALSGRNAALAKNSH
jgi:hypothetical protein